MSKHRLAHFMDKRWIVATALAGLFSTSAWANDAVSATIPTLDSGNTAWMITATVLVLLMSIPGIALFYGGLVRQKNVLSIIMQTMSS